MLSRGKQLVLRAAEATGVLSLVAATPWRARRLMILAYHGVALDDEHAWQPRLYLRQETLRRRLAWLRRHRYAILPLAEGVERLRTGALPPRAVVLTFDDGFSDFPARAYPVLQEFDCPATLYLSTWHTAVRDPVPALMLRYLLWKGRGAAALPGHSGDLRQARSREAVAAAIERQQLPGSAGYPAWRERLREVAGRLGIDYDAILATRLLQFMRPDEVAALDRRLVTVELHTHRHRVPRDEALFRRELADNRRALAAMLGPACQPGHFCYPSGEHYPELLPWLRGEGIRSATTCEPGLAGPADDPLLLPRFLDGEAVSAEQFAAWAGGLNEWLPRLHRQPGFSPPSR